MIRELPVVMTVLGMVLGVDGLMAWPKPIAFACLLVSSLLVPMRAVVVDHLAVELEDGEHRFARAVDVALAYSITWRCMPTMLGVVWLSGLVMLQTSGAKFCGHRLSGRTAAAVAAIAWCIGSS